MAPSHPQYSMRPSPSSTVIVGDTITAGKDYFKQLVSNIDPQKFFPIAAFAATLGLGGAAFYYAQQSKTDKPEDTQPAPAKKRSKSKSLKRRSKTKSNRVVFQCPLDDNPSSAGPDEGDSVEIEHTVTVPEDTVVVQQQRGKTDNGDGISKLDENNNLVASARASGVRIHDNALILKQCPRGRKTPCIAPFPLKLETFLRVHKIKYELDFNGHEPRLYGSPWIRFNTEDITDSQNVIQFLIEQYNIKTEWELSSEQRAMATAYKHLLENHLYWGIALWRWVYDGARSLKDIQLLPKNTQALIPDVCKTVEQAAWFHGIGKMTPEEVKRAVLQDLHSLSGYLGSKDYFMNTSIPTEMDCTAFGMLAQFLWNMTGPFHDAIVVDFKNLRDFCWRIRLNYWPDWEDCLNNTQFYSNEPYPTADTVKYPF